MALEVVSSMAGDANLVLAAVLETVGLVCYLCEEPEPVFLGGFAVFDHGCECLDLCCNGGDGGGEDGVELAEVCKAAGEVDGEGIEGVSVLCEEGEGVWRVEDGLGGHGGRTLTRAESMNKRHPSHVRALINRRSHLNFARLRAFVHSVATVLSIQWVCVYGV